MMRSISIHYIIWRLLQKGAHTFKNIKEVLELLSKEID